MTPEQAQKLTKKPLHTTKKQKSLIKQWHNSNFSDELKPCQTLSD